jgi:hypothetical protein
VLEDLGGDRLGVIPLDLRHTRADDVAGQAAAHEDDEAVQPTDAVAAVGKGLDPDLELLVLRDRRGHAGQRNQAAVLVVG